MEDRDRDVLRMTDDARDRRQDESKETRKETHKGDR